MESGTLPLPSPDPASGFLGQGEERAEQGQGGEHRGRHGHPAAPRPH